MPTTTTGPMGWLTVVVVVMPSGVEHDGAQRWPHRVRVVVVVVMPSGVEHQRLPIAAQASAVVVVVVMPSGVEHFGHIKPLPAKHGTSSSS